MKITPRVTVFLSYASEDRTVAARLAEALRSENVDVWFDQEELRGGDAWDAKIRERIRTCTLFVPLISHHTEARAEGYFRREWRLAIDRSHDMAEDRPFLLPVAISPVELPQARVPERFRELQWLRLPGGEPAAALVARIGELHAKLTAPAKIVSRPGPLATATAPRPPRWTRTLKLILGAVALAAVVWLWTFRSLLTGDAEKNSIAVLPFVNVGGSPDSEYFSDGLTEELLDALARNPALRTVARTSCFAFKGRNLSAPEIGTKLGVARLVEGTVRRVGDRLRVVVQLINAANGYRLWSHTLEVPASDAFSLQAQLVQLVQAQLGPTAAANATVPATNNPDAYDAFLRGRSFQAKGPTRESLIQASAYFRRAVALDPSYALAWANSAVALIRLYDAGFDDADTTIASAREAIAKALQLQPELPEAHHALASLHTINWGNPLHAEPELLKAVKTRPNDSEMLIDLAAIYLNLGRRAEAVDYIRKAAQADPQNAAVANYAGVIFDKAGLYPEAIAARERAFQLTGWTAAVALKAVTYRNWKGDLGLALRTLESVRPTERSEDFEAGLYWTSKAALHSAEGNFDAALAAAEKMPAIAPQQFFYNTRAFVQARIREAMGDTAGARADYERALAEAEDYRAKSPKKVRAYTLLALIYAGLGRNQEAWAAAEEAVKIIPPSQNPYAASRAGLRVMAQVAARTGRVDQALAIVRSQVEAGFWKHYDLMLDDDWRILRRDPRFLELAKRADR